MKNYRVISPKMGDLTGENSPPPSTAALLTKQQPDIIIKIHKTKLGMPIARDVGKSNDEATGSSEKTILSFATGHGIYSDQTASGMDPVVTSRPEKISGN